MIGERADAQPRVGDDGVRETVPGDEMARRAGKAVHIEHVRRVDLARRRELSSELFQLATAARDEPQRRTRGGIVTGERGADAARGAGEKNTEAALLGHEAGPPTEGGCARRRISRYFSPRLCRARRTRSSTTGSIPRTVAVMLLEVR